MPVKNTVMDQDILKQMLIEIEQCLQQMQSPHAVYLQQLIKYCDTDIEKLYGELNSVRMWGGAESVANEALRDNPGLSEWEWQPLVQTYRSHMIELGEFLMQGERSYPDISSWLLAFNNWNQAGH